MPDPVLGVGTDGEHIPYFDLVKRFFLGVSRQKHRTE